jgi:hypothetical protein
MRFGLSPAKMVGWPTHRPSLVALRAGASIIVATRKAPRRIGALSVDPMAIAGKHPPRTFSRTGRIELAGVTVSVGLAGSKPSTSCSAVFSRTFVQHRRDFLSRGSTTTR